MNNVLNGVVKWYDSQKGFGFIAQESGKDVFVHFTGLEDRNAGLNEGDQVEFEVIEGPKGLQAKSVRKV